MKQSIFNHIAPMPKGGFALYNFFTGKCAYLNPFSRDYYDNPELYGPHHSGVQKLVQSGFLVEHDELRYLETLVKQGRGYNSSVAMIICPTLMCNFACPYCYETARPGKMSEETQKNLVGFVEKMLVTNHSSRLVVTWYGGEPLLEKDIIRFLSGEFIRICEKRHIDYTSKIITNGYYLTEDTNDLFIQCRISQMQITIDGPDEQTHNKTRCLRGGGGTFDRIMRNLRSFHAPCRISVRCNVQKDNASGFPALKTMLEEFAHKNGRKISVHPGHMDGFKSYIDKEIDWEDMQDIHKQNSEKLPRYAYKGSVCMMHRSMQMVVDELGNLYKCFECVGVDKYIIGNVKDFNPLMPSLCNPELLCESLETIWPDDDEECMHCPVLPACLGGCPHHRRTRDKQCELVKFALDKYVTAVCREMRKSENR